MKVVSIQLEMADKPKAENVKHALSAIDRVPVADLILLPEIWTCGFFAFERYADESEPFAGIVTHEKYNTLPHRSIGHYTHEKNALCAAAALAEIEVIETQKLAGHAADLGAYTLQRLNEMKDRHPLIGHVAGLGLHIVDLVKDRATKQRAVDEAEIVMFKCMERGLSFKTIDGNVLTLRPALVITREEMDRALDILEKAIGEVESGGG